MITARSIAAYVDAADKEEQTPDVTHLDIATAFLMAKEALEKMKARNPEDEQQLGLLACTIMLARELRNIQQCMRDDDAPPAAASSAG